MKNSNRNKLSNLYGKMFKGCDWSWDKMTMSKHQHPRPQYMKWFPTPEPQTTNTKNNGISVVGTASVALSVDTVVTGLRLVHGLIPQPRNYSEFPPPFTRKNMQQTRCLEVTLREILAKIGEFKFKWFTKFDVHIHDNISEQRAATTVNTILYEYLKDRL